MRFFSASAIPSRRSVKPSKPGEVAFGVSGKDCYTLGKIIMGPHDALIQRGAEAMAPKR